MKKAVSIYIILLISAFIYANIVLLKDASETQVIFLIDGSTIETGEAWEVADEVFYEKNDELYSIEMEDVERIGNGGPQYVFRQINSRVTAAISLGGEKDESSEGTTYPAIDTYMAWIKNIFLMAVLGGLAFALMGFLKLKRKSGQLDIVTEESFDEKRKDFNDMEKIVDFFLDLFKIQLGASKDTKATFLPVASQSSGSSHVYELRVKNNGDWTSRRMTISTLAEESGSKSKCFSVTYDDRIVVKIPPVSIEDFDVYLENIKVENRIVEKLAPKKCIIPRVSVVLKKIPSVFEGMGWSKEEFEEKSIERLKRFAKYHKHLMINGSFVYFMDLSKYYFLGNIVKEIHDVDNKLYGEITGNPGVIWEPDGYERRYCSEDSSVCSGIQNVFNEYEKEVTPLLAKAGFSSVLRYQIQSWFLIHLGGETVPESEKELSKVFVNELNGLLKKIFNKNQEAVEGYRIAIKDYIRKTSFSQHKAQIISIISNLLELLAWLGEKKVAMRDLKPDNLLVAGDPASYPNFLTSVDEFEIGLIDVETAVVLEASGKGSIEQPMLAGTPLYATPSHLFPNNVLSDTFKDLPGILHYQDWHAIVAMIYNMITGEPLFNQTARLLPTIRNAMQKSIGKTNGLTSVLKDVSRLFWQSATDEFKTKINQKTEMMKDAEVPLPKNAIEMLKNQVSREVEDVDKTIHEVVYSQDIFTGENIRKQLLESSHEKVQKLKEKIENKEGSVITQLTDKEKTIKLLEDIGQLKSKREEFVRMKDSLSFPKAALTATALVEFMFGIVLKTMYPEQWAGQSTGVTVDSDASDNASTIEATLDQ
ncbi:MAG: hypothetical protein JRI53_05560 [Deltaproteobacteria bacterium]|nr:hypothetical protein [Deltaproteobacteria bacterium]